MSNYFFSFPQQVQNDSNASSFSPNASNIIPNCQNNYPISQYPPTQYNTNPSAEVLYSIYNSYQKTANPVYLNSLGTTPGYYPSIQNVSYNGPANMFILRHGEKTSKYYYMDLNGIYRSCKLVDYINSLATQGLPISYIVTCNPAPFTYGDPSMRPQQTASAAVFLLNIPVFIFSGSYDPSGVTAQEIFLDSSSNQFNGTNVLFIWEHSNIQQLYMNLAAGAYKCGRILTNDVSGQTHAYSSIYNLFNNTNSIPDGSYNYHPNNYVNTHDLSMNVPSGPWPTYFSSITDASGQITSYGDPNDQIFKISPYWNNECFDLQVNFLSNSSGKFSFSVSQEPINTCYANCNLQVGMYQIPSPSGQNSFIYCQDVSGNVPIYLENNCDVPLDI
jgi:hypothetical protein